MSVVYAGTRTGLPGSGPGGSRFTVMIAGAVQGAAAKIRNKAIKVAAHMLEVERGRSRVLIGWRPGAGQPGEPEVTRGDRRHAAPFQAQPSRRHRQRLRGPHGLRPSAHDADQRGPLRPRDLLSDDGHACHIPIVEVDVETGRCHVPQVRGRTRLRHTHQPAVARRPHRRRPRAGRRPVPARAVRLQPRRAAAHRPAISTT